MTSGRPRALTLLEVLVTMALLLVALAMIATMVRNFTAVTAHLDGKEGTQQGGMMLLSIAAELEEATTIGLPAIGTTIPESEIALTKFASTSRRLQTATTPSTWSPRFVLSVRYYQAGENLIREVIYPGGSKSSAIVSNRLNGFSANRLNDRVIEVRATFRESKRLETLTARAYRWRAEP